MDAQHSEPRGRIRWYIYAYLWLGLTAVSTLPFLFVSGLMYDDRHVLEGLSLFACLVVLFQGLFWFARRRCSSSTLSGWEGLLLVCAYMCIGISGIYAIVAMVSGAVAAVCMVAIALWSLVRGGHEGAMSNFRGLVLWFQRHRMYQ